MGRLTTTEFAIISIPRCKIQLGTPRLTRLWTCARSSLKVKSCSTQKNIRLLLFHQLLVWGRNLKFLFYEQEYLTQTDDQLLLFNCQESLCSVWETPAPTRNVTRSPWCWCNACASISSRWVLNAIYCCEIFSFLQTKIFA